MASGHVDHDRELVGSAELRDQGLQCLAQVRDRGLCYIALVISSHARAQLRMRAPDTVLVLLDDIRTCTAPVIAVASFEAVSIP